MTRPPNPKSKTHTIIVRANDEIEVSLINYLKEVCARDGLEYRKEILKLIEVDWKARHPPPGNPQIMLFQSIEKKKVHEVVVCEVCGEHAVYRCTTIFSINSVKMLCQSHTVQFERRREVTKKVKL